MTGEASRKPRRPGWFCTVEMIYSPELIAKTVYVGTIKAMLANEDHPNHHPPTPGVLWPHLDTSGLGSLARVFFAGNGASATDDVELPMTCTTLRKINQGQGCNGGYTALGRQTRTTITTQPTHPTPTNFNPRPTTFIFTSDVWRPLRAET